MTRLPLAMGATCVRKGRRSRRSVRIGLSQQSLMYFLPSFVSAIFTSSTKRFLAQLEPAPPLQSLHLCERSVCVAGSSFFARRSRSQSPCAW